MPLLRVERSSTDWDGWLTCLPLFECNEKTALKDSFSGSWWCIYYVYVYIVPYFESTQVPYSEKIELSLIVLIHCHGFWWFLHVETPMNLMLFVSYIFFVMCRQNPLRGTSMGDAELGLVVLKARNWSFFFWKLDRKIQFVGWRGVFFPGAEKGVFREKMFHLSTFQVMMLVVTITEKGDGPLNDVYFQTASQVRRQVDAVKTQFVYYLSWTLLESQQIQRKHHIIWYYCTILYNLFSIQYISIIYTWLISFQGPAINFLWTFWGPNFFRNLPGMWSSRFSSLAFG